MSADAWADDDGVFAMIVSDYETSQQIAHVYVKLGRPHNRIGIEVYCGSTRADANARADMRALSASTDAMRELSVLLGSYMPEASLEQVTILLRQVNPGAFFAAIRCAPDAAERSE